MMTHSPYRKISFPVLLSGIILFAFTGCNSDDQDQEPDNKDIPVVQYSYLGFSPHDTASYTEGLLVSNDTLFESSGSPQLLPQCRSVFGPVNQVTGSIDVRVELDRERYFGEGIAYLDGKFYQLTYRNRIGFIYNAANYETIGQFTFLSDEGWGLTTDGESLIMSDGTDRLTWIDPITFLPSKFLSVTRNALPVTNLNELEFIRGFIYANVLRSDTVVKIDPSTGKVTGLLGLASFREEAHSLYPGSGETNGIAYDPAADKIYVTGKLWPRIYAIRLSD